MIIIYLLFPCKELLKCSSLSETGMGVDSDNAVPISYSNTYYVDLGMDAVRFSIWENLPSLRIESPGWYLFQLSPATFITLPLVLSPVSFHTLCGINCQINPFPNFTIKERLLTWKDATWDGAITWKALCSCVTLCLVSVQLNRTTVFSWKKWVTWKKWVAICFSMASQRSTIGQMCVFFLHEDLLSPGKANVCH